MLDSKPLVSIGLPTYNRASKLRRAVESVLAQDYTNLELVISDNASTDETEAACLEFCRRDRRVRCIRQQINRGLTANYSEVLSHSRGEFFMWLSDDDWLDNSYISQCLTTLVEHPDYALVCGRAKYFRGEEYFFDGEVELLQESGSDRVLAYYKHVGRNGTFYGVTRRELLTKLPMQNTIAGDWLLVAAIAFTGKVKMLDGVSINRHCEGTSENLTRLALSFGLSKYQAKAPFLKITTNVFNDIARLSPAYGSMDQYSRLSLAFRASAIIIKRYLVPYTRTQIAAYVKRQRLISHRQ